MLKKKKKINHSIFFQDTEIIIIMAWLRKQRSGKGFTQKKRPGDKSILYTPYFKKKNYIKLM